MQREPPSDKLASRRSVLKSTAALGMLDLDWDFSWFDDEEDSMTASDQLNMPTEGSDSVSVSELIAGERLRAVKSADETVTLSAVYPTPRPIKARSGLARQYKPERYSQTDRASVTTLSSASSPKHLDIVGTHAIVVGQGLSVIDISDPADMNEVGGIPDTDIPDAYGVAVWDTTAWVSEIGDDRVTAVDIADPENPSIFGRTSVTGPRKITCRNGYAFVSSTESAANLYVVDISDPKNPSQAATLSDSKFARSFEIALRDDTAFVVGRKNDVVTAVDVSDPTAPAIVGSYSGSPLVEPYGVSLQDEYAYVTLSDNGHGLAVLDISDPSNISSVGSVTDSTNLNSPYGLAVDGYGVYSVCKDNDTYVRFDVSSPSSPSVSSSVSFSSFNLPYEVQIQDGHAFAVARGSSTITSLGIRDRKWN